MNAYNPKDWYWYVAGNESQVYSSSRAAMISVEEPTFVEWMANETFGPSRIFSMDELRDVLRAANVPPHHTVSSYRIVRRLEEAGVAEVALQVIDAPANAVLKARFYALGEIPADDPDAIALIAAAGADPDVILAPEIAA